MVMDGQPNMLIIRILMGIVAELVQCKNNASIAKQLGE
jgi:hypothetical protein